MHIYLMDGILRQLKEDAIFDRYLRFLIVCVMLTQLLRQFNIKMQSRQRNNWSPGKTHVIRLNQKDLTVHVYYSSPQPKDKRGTQNSTPPTLKYHLPPIPKGPSHPQHNIKPQIKNKIRKKDQQLNKKNQKEFYINRLEECYTLLLSYEQFHLNLAQKKTNKRLKVYSNSKTQSQEESITKYQPVPVKAICLKSSKQQPSASAVLNNSSKITSTKKKSEGNRRLQRKVFANIATIRLYENSEQRIGKIVTPQKHRSHKLSVISSSSRKKHGSLIGKGCEASSEFLRIRKCSGQQGESIIVNSFNTSLNH